MDHLYERCCGIDIHKRILVACFRDGSKETVKEFGTFTEDIRKFANWLIDLDCEMSAIESTGIYWKPVYNVMEALGMSVMVVNAAHMKNVPGRKTDVKDAQWIAQLLQNGLLRASFIPNQEQREMRDIVRFRKKLVQERSDALNRLDKSLESGNIKLSSVLSGLDGVCAQKLLRTSLERNIDIETVEEIILPRMREKAEDIVKAMQGVMSDLQKWLVKTAMDHIFYLTQLIHEIDDKIDGIMQEYKENIERLKEMPGIGDTSAKAILAEIGQDMSRFHSAAHLASWCGLSPGNNESAGKRRSGKTCKGNKNLKTVLIQCAQAACHQKDTYYYAQYQRLATRRGKNRAKVAVAHSMLRAIYFMLSRKEGYKELGADYYNQFNTESKINYHVKKLRELGYPETALVVT
jgi:transposase